MAEIDPKQKLTLRTIRCWARIVPRAKGRPTTVTRIHRTKREATAARREREIVVQLRGFYFPDQKR